MSAGNIQCSEVNIGPMGQALKIHFFIGTTTVISNNLINFIFNRCPNLYLNCIGWAKFPNSPSRVGRDQSLTLILEVEGSKPGIHIGRDVHTQSCFLVHGRWSNLVSCICGRISNYLVTCFISFGVSN